MAARLLSNAYHRDPRLTIITIQKSQNAKSSLNIDNGCYMTNLENRFRALSAHMLRNHIISTFRHGIELQTIILSVSCSVPFFPTNHLHTPIDWKQYIWTCTSPIKLLTCAYVWALPQPTWISHEAMQSSPACSSVRRCTSPWCCNVGGMTLEVAYCHSSATTLST